MRLLLFFILLLTSCVYYDMDKYSSIIKEIMKDEDYPELQLEPFLNSYYPGDKYCRKESYKKFGTAFHFNCKQKHHKNFVIIHLNERVSIQSVQGFEQFIDSANDPKYIIKDWYVITHQEHSL